MKKSEQSQRTHGASAGSQQHTHERIPRCREKGAERIFEKTMVENFPNERHEPTNPRSSTNPKLDKLKALILRHYN